MTVRFPLSLPVLVAVLCLAATTGCNNRGRPRGTGTDSGTIMTSDGGMTGRDGGTILIMDGGMVGRDGGAMGCVPACSTGQECRSGVCVPVTGMCRSMPIDPVSGVFCSSSTTTCIDGCADGACVVACLEGDPSTDCFACANQNIIACEAASGCQSQWDCVATCLEDNCPTGSPSGCVDTSCPSQLAAWNACTAGTTECGTAWTTCIP